MAFDSAAFYSDLDRYFSQHDNEATEKFLLETLESIENSMLITPGGGCCCDDEAACEGPTEEEIKWAVERSQGMIAVLNELACFYRGLSRLDESMNAFNRVKEEMEFCGLGESEGYAVVLINLAGTYRLMGKYDEALQAYETSKKLLLKNENSNPYNFASLYNNLGLVYQDLKDYAKAAQALETALDYLPKTRDNWAELATNYSILAMAYYSSGDMPKAKQRLDEALAIFKELDDGKNPHYAGALNTKAVFLFKEGKYQEAAEAFETAIEITKLVYGENREYITGCRNCSLAYKKAENSEKAAYYQELADRAESKG
jgi:tetratricopeptide (TPR) repeat protein